MKRIVRKSSHHHKIKHVKKTSARHRFFWLSFGFLTIALALLVGSATVFTKHTDVLGAQIAMLTTGSGGSGSGNSVTGSSGNSGNACKTTGSTCGVNNDCCTGNYCSKTGKCTKYCTQSTKKNVCNGTLTCTATYNTNKICGSTTYTNCQMIIGSCNLKVCPANYNRVVTPSNSTVGFSTPGLGLDTAGSNAQKCGPVDTAEAMPKTANTCVVRFGNTNKCESGYGSYGFFNSFGAQDSVGESCQPNPAYKHVNTVIDCPKTVSFEIQVVDKTDKTPISGIEIDTQVNDRKYKVTTGKNGIASVPNVHQGDFVYMTAISSVYIFTNSGDPYSPGNEMYSSAYTYSTKTEYACGSKQIGQGPCTFSAQAKTRTR